MLENVVEPTGLDCLELCTLDELVLDDTDELTPVEDGLIVERDVSVFVDVDELAPAEEIVIEELEVPDERVDNFVLTLDDVIGTELAGFEEAVDPL